MGHGSSRMDALTSHDIEFLKTTSKEKEKKEERSIRSQENSLRNVEQVEISEVSGSTSSTKDFLCKLCNYRTSWMPAFKRHLDYSSMHKDNLNKVEKSSKRFVLLEKCVETISLPQEKCCAPPTICTLASKRWVKAIHQTICQNAVAATVTNLIERGPQSTLGRDHIQICSLSKIFWRVKQTVHVDIFLVS